MFDCNRDITLFIRYKDPNDKQAGEVFYPYLLPVKCKFKTKNIKTATGTGAGSSVNIANSRMVIIPYTDDYLPPDVWNILMHDEKSQYFTLKIDDNVYPGVTDMKMADVKALKKDDVFTIKAIQDNTNSLYGKHWRVEGV